jgi:hypothetical protein
MVYVALKMEVERFSGIFILTYRTTASYNEENQSMDFNEQILNFKLN